jgi:hypothetical protein
LLQYHQSKLKKDPVLLGMCAGMWVMLDIVPNHSGYFAPENIHEMTFTSPEHYHSCSRECPILLAAGLHSVCCGVML